ncbi:hypothetical protein [Algoriphagus vanfongensis]|uniref:hypothetical protein n=1 Tax=Algoriphagus vanfongensis TaxID=426371 RepID=UPI00042A20F6|nr:hypothetical protein [Algoriphagus vanfongensis]
MKNILKLISILGLVMSILPPLLLFFGEMDLESMKLWMGIGMVAWMCTAPFWVNSKTSEN